MVSLPAAQPPSADHLFSACFFVHSLVWVSSSEESQVYDRKEKALPGNVTLWYAVRTREC